jgi:hypothetical protein
MYAVASRQISAQSMSSAMQRAIFWTSFSRRQEEAQWLHATAQALQASMQDLNCSWGMGVSPRRYDGRARNTLTPAI